MKRQYSNPISKRGKKTKGSFASKYRHPKFNANYGPMRWVGMAKPHQGELKVNDITSNDTPIKANSSGSVSTTVDGSNAAATHNIAVLNSMAQGTDFTGRVGRKIVCKSLLLDILQFPITTASSPDGDIMRVMVFWDFQSNGATTFTLANLLTDFSASPTVSATTPINLNYRDRFKVLMDKRYFQPASNYAAGSLTTGSPQPRNIKKYIKLGNVTTTFNDTGTGVYGDVMSGALMLLVFSENGASFYTYSARVRFVDA